MYIAYNSFPSILFIKNYIKWVLYFYIWIFLILRLLILNIKNIKWILKMAPNGYICEIDT